MKKINIGKLKYIIPTIATPFIMAGCGYTEDRSGRIIDKTNNVFYVDVNGDSLVDFKLIGFDFRPLFAAYAEKNDSIEFSVTYPVYGNPFVLTSDEYDIRTINGHTEKEILNIMHLNKLRQEVGQQKVR